MSRAPSPAPRSAVPAPAHPETAHAATASGAAPPSAAPVPWPCGLFRRHDLVWLGSGAADLDGPWVVAQTPPDLQRLGALRLGRCRSDPTAAGKAGVQRIAGRALAAEVYWHRPPLGLAELQRRLPGLPRPWLRTLEQLRCWAAVRADGLSLGVYGSLAWQALAGASLLHRDSDLDLLITLEAGTATGWLLQSLAALESLSQASETAGGPRIDGELRLADGSDLSWREALQALRGEVGRLLVKRDGALLLAPASELMPPGVARVAQTPETLDRLAIQALRSEADSWPKPGLVSPVDCGSHSDMDIRLLHRAIDALQGWFAALARAAACGADFARLAAIGRAAEAAMLEATGGVNAYRGAIFNLGLLVAAAASAPAGCPPTDWVRQRWGRDIAAHRPPASSHGSLVRRRDGAAGALAEAAQGFPTLHNRVLPALQDALRRGFAPERARLAALLASMAVLEDSNLLWRGGPAGLAWAQAQARDWLSQDRIARPDWRAGLAAVHREFVARRLSPGGSADLLACASFLVLLAPNAAP